MTCQLNLVPTQKMRDSPPALLQEYGMKLKHGSRQGNISRLFRIYNAIRYALQQTREMSASLFTSSEQDVSLNLDTKRKRNEMMNSLRLYEQNTHKHVYLRNFTST